MPRDCSTGSRRPSRPWASRANRPRPRPAAPAWPRAAELTGRISDRADPGPSARTGSKCCPARGHRAPSRRFDRVSSSSDARDQSGVMMNHKKAVPVRRRTPPPPRTATTVAPNSPLELQQTAGNRAVVARLTEPTRLPATPVSTPTSRVVMREPAPEVEAPAYVETFGEQLGDGVRDFLARQPFVLPSPFLSWRTPNSFTTAALDAAGAPGGRALPTGLRDLLHPDELVELVNRGRKKGTVQVTDEKTTWTEERTNAGPANWYPDVAIEIGQILAQRFLESLGRMAPRYLEARVAAAVQAEAEHQASMRSAPEPSGALLTSDPLDVLTANSLRGTALTGGGVLFDWPGYHMANPQAVGHAGGPRPVTFTVEPAHIGTHLVRVTSPADSLPEEFVFAIYGATTETPLIGVAAPPLFGFVD